MATINHYKPNFLIVGAAKSGTTALANFLNQHPDIYIPDIKEPRYFAKADMEKIDVEDPLYSHIHNSSVLLKDEYYKLFRGRDGYRCRGEASVHYLYHHRNVIPKIQNELGDIKIIIILRNPINRAFSNYLYITEEEYLFNIALRKEKERMEKGYNSFWYYKHLGFYYNQVKAYINNFTNVKVLIYEEFKENPKMTCKEVFEFLGIDSEETINTDRKYNVTKVPKSNFKKFLLRFEKRAVLLKKVMMKVAGDRLRAYKKTWFVPAKYEIDEKLYISLLEEYIEDINRLEKLLDIDLSHWKVKNKFA